LDADNYEFDYFGGLTFMEELFSFTTPYTYTCTVTAFLRYGKRH